MVNDYRGLAEHPNAILGYCEAPRPGAYLALASEATIEGLAAVAERDGDACDVTELFVNYGPHFALPGQTTLCTMSWGGLNSPEKAAIVAYFVEQIKGARIVMFPCL